MKLTKSSLLSSVLLLALFACGEQPAVSSGPCVNHVKGEFIRRVSPSDATQGKLAHYKCKRCEALLDLDGQEVNENDLVLPCYEDRVDNFADYIVNEDSSTCGKWEDIDEASKGWSHQDGSDSVATNNISAWRLSEDNFHDLEFTLEIDHSGIRNPYHSGEDDFITKAFFVGASINANVSFPKGYAISFNTTANNGSYYSDSWIQIWEVNNVTNNKMKGLFIGGANVQTENGCFTFKIIDGVLSIHDRNEKAISITDDSLKSSLYYLPLPKYKGGKVGIYNWALSEKAVNTTFSITEFRACRDEEGSMIEKDGIGVYSNLDKSKMVNVFLLCGQSNMEGNSRAYDGANTYLKNFCDDSNGKHIYSHYKNGYESVQISTHTKYPYGANCNFSNSHDPLFGEFNDTKLGYGQAPGDKYFGPELGLAETLDSEDIDNPVYLIKFASGGTGFSTYPSWLSPKSSSTPGALYRGLISFVYNNLSSIMDEGYIPVIKGFLWMQGEADSSYATASYYDGWTTGLIESVREEFAKYAIDGNGDNIAFIDAYISDRSVWEGHSVINYMKKSVANLHPNNYVIDTNSTGLGLVINNDGYGGGDAYHYTVDSSIKLGNAYGQIIVDNNILRF